LTRRYAAALEPWIRARPELWLWMHSRWQRTRKQRRPEAIARLVEEAHLPPRRRSTRPRAPPPQTRRRGDWRSSRATTSSRTRAICCWGRARTRRAAFGRAIAGLGHATRYLTLDQVRDRLARAREDGRLDGELRDLDPIPLLVIDAAGALPPETPTMELLARLLAHRLERGSVVLAGASAAQWRAAAAVATPVRSALDAFLDTCEVIDPAGLDSRPLAVTDPAAAAPPRETRPDPEADARAIRA
jgi:hypothetical protein